MAKLNYLGMIQCHSCGKFFPWVVMRFIKGRAYHNPDNRQNHYKPWTDEFRNR